MTGSRLPFGLSGSKSVFTGNLNKSRLIMFTHKPARMHLFMEHCADLRVCEFV